MPVVARWAKQDKGMLLPLFRLIASGEPLDETQLAEDLNIGADAFSVALNTSLAEIDSLGRVSELFGITRETTLHRIDVGEETLYSCCALVAHMVPAIIQQAVTVESIDPINGDKIRLAISADSELQHVHPLTTRSSMVDCAVEEIITSPRKSAKLMLKVIRLGWQCSFPSSIGTVDRPKVPHVHVDVHYFRVVAADNARLFPIMVHSRTIQ